MNKIYVIGGGGFLGTCLIKKLKINDNSEVFCGDLKKSKITQKNIIINVEKPETFDQISYADTIINLAAVHRDDIKPKTKYDDVNVQGAKNICNLARDIGTKNIIFTSSVAIYGFAPPNTDESGDPNYFNDYGRTKFLAENIYKEWYQEDPSNRNLTIIRPTVIFGKGNRGNVYNLLNQVAKKRFVMIGNGKNIKSMAYVENVVAFIDFCIKKNKGINIYNYVDKPDFDMNELVSVIRKKLFGKDNVGIRLPAFFGYFIGYFADLLSYIFRISLPVSSIRIKKFMGTTQFDSSAREAGFSAPFSLKDALEETITYEFIDDNSDKQTFDTE